MSSPINWFEIPVTNLDRAAAFYERVLGVSLKKELFGAMRMAIFQSAKLGTGGALVVDERRKPSTDGTLAYLDARGDLDVEGNLVGLHQPR